MSESTPSLENQPTEDGPNDLAAPTDPRLHTIEDPGHVTAAHNRHIDTVSVPRSAPRTDGGLLDQRYEIGRRLGGDTGGRLYAGTDALLVRPLSFKVLPATSALDPVRRRRFFHEARIAASLEHPNIPPIHDLDSMPDGGLYFTTRHVGDLSLDEAIRRAKAGRVPREIATWRHLGTIFLKVCDALAAAHDRGLIHRDVKPAHILIGAHGEVLLGGWQDAGPLAEQAEGKDTLVGTPAFMAPEQARGETLTRAADVYALGASLYQALTGELPIWDADEAAFWAKKRAGSLDPIPIEALTRVEPALLEVARAALSTDPAARPADAAAFAERLTQTLEHLAAQEIAQARARQRRRRRWRLVAVTTIVLALIGGGLAAVGDHLRERWNLPPLLLAEYGDGELWDPQLRVLADWDDSAESQSAFTKRGHRLVSSGPLANYLFLDRRLSGRVVVEFVGEWLAGHPAGDLSVVWVPQDPFRSAQPLNGANYLQVGANDNLYSGIFLHNASRAFRGGRATMVDFRLEPGRRYHFRYEIDGADYLIAVDGKTICEFRDPSIPPRTGWVGLYAYFPGKAFSHLRIHAARETLVPITAIGEAYLHDGLYERAVEEFARLADELGTSPLGQECRYRHGMALALAGDRQAARAAFDAVEERPWADLALAQRLDLDVRAGEHEMVLSSLRHLYRTSPDLHPQLHLLWSRVIRDLAQRGHPDIDRYLALERDLFPPLLVTRTAAAEALLILGRPAEVLERFADCRGQAAEALLRLGREREVLDRFPDRASQVQRALLNLGRFEEVVTRYDHSAVKELALVLSGRPEKALAAVPFPGASAKELALLALGRADELGRDPGWIRTAHQGVKLVAQGQLEEAVDLLTTPLYRHERVLPNVLLRLDRPDAAAAAITATDATTRHQIAQYRLLQAYIAADSVQIATRRAELIGPTPTSVNQPGWLFDLVLLPALEQFAGDREAMARAKAVIAQQYRERWAGMAWHAAMYVDGFIDHARLAQQPVQLVVPAMECLCRALRLDLAGDAVSAAAAYAEYLALPYGQRLWGNINGDPVTDRFAAWRLTERGGTP